MVINKKFGMLIAVFVMMMFMISMVASADFDNVKYKEEKTWDNKKVKGNKLLEKYKPIKIKNMFGLGETLFEGYIDKHDEICVEDCSSTLKIRTGKDGILIDEVIFKTQQQDNSWIEQDVRSYQFYINTEGEKITVEDYEYQCELLGHTENGTIIEECNDVYLGNHIEDAPTWTPYKLGEVVSKGTYEVKLDAKKKPSRTVDWVIKTNGEWLESWATWGRGYIDRVYDEINDSSINGSLWTTSVVGTDTRTRETSSQLFAEAGYTLNGGTDAGTVTVQSNNLDRTKIENLTIQTYNRIYTESGAGPCLATSTLSIFGTNINHLTTTSCGIDTSDTTVWTVIRNEGAGANKWDVYDDGVFSQQITASTNIIFIFSEHQSSGSEDSFGDTRIGYVYYFGLDGLSYLLLNSPESNYISQTNEVEFDCSAEVVGGATIVNMSLWNNVSGTWANVDSTVVGDYEIFDDFEDNSFNTTMWDEQGTLYGTAVGTRYATYSETNEELYLTGYGSTNGGGGGLQEVWTKAGILDKDDVLAVNISFVAELSRAEIGSDTANTNIVVFGTSVAPRTFASNYNTDYTESVFIHRNPNNLSEFLYEWNGTLLTEGVTLTNISGSGSFEPTDSEIYFSAYGWGNYQPPNYGAGEGELTIKEITISYADGTWENILFEDLVYDTTIWTCEACDSDGDCGFGANNTLHIDPYAPDITIIKPITKLDFGKEGDDIELEWELTDDNLDSCWYKYPMSDELCFQEDANISNQTGVDGDCDLNYNGTYDVTGSWSWSAGRLHDGDYQTYRASSSGYMFINYTMPEGATELSNWTMKHEWGTENISLNGYNCFNEDILKLRFFSFYSGGGRILGHCQDDDGLWVEVFDTGAYVPNGHFIYEEAMYWDIATPVNCSDNSTTFQQIEGENQIEFFAYDVVGNGASKVRNWTYYIWQNEATFNSRVPEISEQTFTTNLSLPDDDVISSAKFFYNGTSYSPDITLTDDYAFLSYELTTPNVELTLDFPFFWQVTINPVINTTTENQTVIGVAMDDCSNHSELVLNFTLVDEVTELIIGNGSNSSIEIDLTMQTESGSEVLTFSQIYSDTPYASVCLEELTNDTSYYIDAVVSYVADGYVEEFWFLDDGILTVDSDSLNDYVNKNVTLRSLNLDDSTTFLMSYQNEFRGTVPDSIVSVLRKYIGQGEFKEVERCQQDNNGQCHIHLVEEDVIYQFRITYLGELQYLSGEYNAKCLESLCKITITKLVDGGEWDVEADNLEEGTYSVSSDKDSRTVTLAFNLDETGTMQLDVYEYDNTADADVLVGTSSATAKTGSTEVEVPLIYGNKTYYAVVRHNSGFVSSQWVDLNESGFQYFGALGLFLGALLILTLGLIAVSSGGWTIGFLMLGMFVASITKLVDMDFYLMMWIVSAGGLIIWKLSTRRSI